MHLQFEYLTVLVMEKRLNIFYLQVLIAFFFRGVKITEQCSASFVEVITSVAVILPLADGRKWDKLLQAAIH